MGPVPDFADHRNRLLQELRDDEAVLVFGGPHLLRNGDAEYRYRPDSMLYWLTGWEDPEVAVFIKPGDEPFTVFVQPKDQAREIWTGVRPGPEGATDTYGADCAHPYSALEQELPRLLQGVGTLHYGFADAPDNDGLVMASVAKAKRAARYNGLSYPEVFVHPEKLLHELRLHKGDDEVAVMRRAAQITAEAHELAMRAARPGVYEFEIESLLLGHWRKRGSTGPGYTPIVAGGAGACILHYITNRAPLREGELLLIDAGAEHCYYTADVTRTFPVSGTFSEAQRRVYAWVLEAQKACIAACRPGTSFAEVHQIATRVLTTGMVDLGLLQGDVDELIESDSHKAYYMHGTSHWLGLDVHDVGSYGRLGESRRLEPGMVLTIEPGLYVLPTDENAPEELRGIGIRIEDDVLITNGDPEVLTAAVPKEIAEIEAACQANRSS